MNHALLGNSSSTAKYDEYIQKFSSHIQYIWVECIGLDNVENLSIGLDNVEDLSASDNTEVSELE
jgi:hypothetical protein